jgi:hypothetical protein
MLFGRGFLRKRPGQHELGLKDRAGCLHHAVQRRRHARALVRWRAQDLARESAVGVATIRRAELVDSETSMTAANDLAVRRALESAGVEFIDENGGGPGVRLRRPVRGKLGK